MGMVGRVKAAEARPASLLTPTYRADIDGLRAVAVLAVVGFHFFPAAFPGGFVGVDVFFVISGYLISTILYVGHEKKAFSFAEFYARRVRRIFPALLVVLAFSLLAGWFVLLSNEFAQLKRHVAAAAAFASNLLLWSEGGYFDTASDEKPLLHLWSLGIEEQFYLVWPLALFAAYRLNKSPLWISGAILALSCVLNLVETARDPLTAFYMPYTRFWELMAGSVLAYEVRTMRASAAWKAVTPRTADALSFAGLALIAISVFTLNGEMRYPGAWALLPVGGAYLVIKFAHHAVVIRRLLSSRLAVWFGLISYPLYLWHWPLLTFARLIDPALLDRKGRLALILISIAAAWLTYRFVEQPIRRKRATQVVVAVSGAMAAVGSFAILISLAGLPPRNNEPGLEKIVRAVGDWQYPPKGFASIQIDGARFELQNSNVARTTLFVGDSNVAQYAPRISLLLTQHPDRFHSVIFAARGGCPPVPSLYERNDARCRRTMEAAFRLAREDRIGAVVIGAAWMGYRNELLKEEHLRSLRGVLAELARQKPTTLLLNIPSGREFDPKTMVSGSRLAGLSANPTADAVPLNRLLQRYGALRDRLKEAAAFAGASVIDPLDHLCSASLCPVVSPQGEPVNKDRGHLRPFHVIANGGFIDQTIDVRSHAKSAN